MVRRTNGRAAAQTTHNEADRNESTSNREPAPRTRQEPEREERRTTAGASSREDTAQTRTTASASGGAPTRSSDDRRAEENLPATQSQTRSLAPVNERNAFESYGQQMSQSTIVGTLIKFSKGDWVDGDDNDVEEADLNGLVANMDQLMVGWIKWQDNKPVEQIMGPVAEGFQAPRRNTLGDDNQDHWETDQDGRPRDPWQFSNYIVLKRPGDDAGSDDLFTFATSSKGGLGAIGKLCRDFGKEMRRRPDDYPIVKLGADSYRHPEYGRTYVPLIEIVGWEPKSMFEGVDSAPSSRNDDADEDRREPEPQPEPRRAASGGRRR